jgi:hypothetical protein
MLSKQLLFVVSFFPQLEPHSPYSSIKDLVLLTI